MADTAELRPVRTPTVVGLGEVLWDCLPGGRRLGGAPANLAYHAAQLGCRGAVASAVGSDGDGREIRRTLEALALETACLAEVPERPTGTVEVELDAAGHPTYRIREGVAWDAIPPSPELFALMERADAVCFGSLAQRSGTSRKTIRAALAKTRETCLRLFDINLRQDYYSREVIEESLRLATVLKINDEELPVVAKLLGLPDPGEKARLEALLERFDLDAAALTRGGRGSLLITREAENRHPGQPVEAVDTVGAGDAFAAAVTVGLLRGIGLERIAEAANRLAACVCTHAGATPPVPPELAEPLRA